MEQGYRDKEVQRSRNGTMVLGGTWEVQGRYRGVGEVQ